MTYAQPMSNYSIIIAINCTEKPKKQKRYNIDDIIYEIVSYQYLHDLYSDLERVAKCDFDLTINGLFYPNNNPVDLHIIVPKQYDDRHNDFITYIKLRASNNE